MVRHLTWLKREDTELERIVSKNKGNPDWTQVAACLQKKRIKKTSGQCKRR